MKPGRLVPLSLASQATVSKVYFSAMNQDDIERMAVVHLNNSKIYENDKPVKNGVNDPRLGVGRSGQ